MTQVLRICHPLADSAEAAGSWLQMGSAPAVGALGVNQHLEDFPLCMSDFPMKIKKNFRN